MALGAATLGALLTDNARRHPDRIAIVCDGRRVTYSELDLLSCSLANALVARGIAPGDRAAVYLPNGIELVVALCGALKAGAIVVPVSTRLAAAEVEIMMEDSKPAAVIFHADARAAVAGTDLVIDAQSFAAIGATQTASDFALSPVVPNPVRGSSRFQFALPREANVRLSVHDVQGRELLILADGAFAPGRHSIDWTSSGHQALDSGLYFVRLSMSGRTITRRFVLMK